MKHLSSEQLSARLDGALTGRAAEEAERHLGACESCRAALAALAAQDEALEPALTHDPGEAYFEGFAGRVGERIRSAGLAGAQARERRSGIGRLFQSPRALAWAGGVAVLVVGAGLALMTSREVRTPELREIAERPQSTSPAAKPEPEAPEPMQSRLDQDKARTGAKVGQEEITRSQASLREREAGKATGATVPAEPFGNMARQKVDRLDHPAPARQPVAGAASPPGAAELQSRGGRSNEVRAVSPNQPAAPALEKSSAGSLKDAKAEGSAKRAADEVRSEAAAPADGFAKPPDAGAQALAPSNERALAPAAGSRSAAKQALGAAPEVQLCGDVRDASGRPIAGAQVTVADVGRTATSDARGAFCIGAPAGEHTLSVMAVGFAESRQTVTVGAGSAVRVTLDAVPVLEDKRASIAGRTPLPRALASAPTEPVDRYTPLPDSVRALVRSAQQLQTTATSGRSARLFDAAAAGWERALRRLEGGPLELETRLHLAEARYHAWEAGPNTRRADTAVEALTAYVVRSQAGPDRDQAVRWLDRVKH